MKIYMISKHVSTLSVDTRAESGTVDAYRRKLENSRTQNDTGKLEGQNANLHRNGKHTIPVK